MPQMEARDEKFLNARIYLELLRYLYWCVDTSIKEYQKKEKCKKIEELRKTMNIVNKCEDVQIIFEEMNRKIKEYRDKVFEINIDDVSTSV